MQFPQRFQGKIKLISHLEESHVQFIMDISDAIKSTFKIIIILHFDIKDNWIVFEPWV